MKDYKVVIDLKHIDELSCEIKCDVTSIDVVTEDAPNEDLVSSATMTAYVLSQLCNDTEMLIHLVKHYMSEEKIDVSGQENSESVA